MRLKTAILCALIWLTAVSGSMFLNQVAYAQAKVELLPDMVVPQDARKRIAFFPKAIPIYLWPNAPKARDIDVTAVRHELMKHARAHKILRVVGDSALNEAFEKNAYEERDAFAQAEIDMAYAETYAASLNYDTALSTLERVLRNFETSMARYFDTKLMSHALQLYAYTQLSMMREMDDVPVDRVHMVRRAFMEFIRISPHVVLLEGRQPKDRVQYYTEARALFMQNAVYRQTKIEDARRLARQLDTDILVFLRFVQKEDGSFDAEIDFYDYENDQMTYEIAPIPDKIDNTSVRHVGEVSEPASVFADAISLKLENLYACLSMPALAPPPLFSGEEGRIYLELNALYFSYVFYETSSAPHTLGASVRVTYMITEHFFVQGAFSASGVFQDSAKDLYDSFQVLRFDVSAGISADFHWIRPYLTIGLEGEYMTPFAITTNLTCKAFGSSDLECGEDDIQDNDTPGWFGFNVAAGFNLGKDPFYLVIEGFLTLNIAPYPTGWFGIPIGATMGVQYRF